MHLQQQAELFEINYASSMVDKMSLDIAPNTANALTAIAKIYMLKCEALYPKYQSLNTPAAKEIGAWL